VLPDGTELTAVSFDAADPYERRDQPPDYCAAAVETTEQEAFVVALPG